MNLKAGALLLIIVVFCAEECENGECSVVQHRTETREPKYTEILTSHENTVEDETKKRFQGETLGYVTPWNGHGYDCAKKYRSKFTFISPVWFQIRKPQDIVTITGTHDVDSQWISDVRGTTDPRPLIVPRFIFEMRSLSATDMKQIPILLRDTIRHYNLDGIVLEIPVVEQVVDLIQAIGRLLQQDDKKMLLVLSPMGLQEQDAKIYHVLRQILPAIDRFSLNMYDYSAGRSGPNAPMPWIRACLDGIDAVLPELLGKILIGVPFYGYDTGEPIVAHQYLDLLRQHQPALEWDDGAEELSFTYQNTRRVYYPSTRFLHQRMEIARLRVAGIAIWELGQGLEIFYDLF